MKDNYSLIGHYSQDGMRHGLRGSLQVVSDGRVDLVLLENGLNQREARGRLLAQDGRQILDFVVEVSDANLLNVRYNLEKRFSSYVGDCSGAWIGFWFPVEKNLGWSVVGRQVDLPSGDSCFPVKIERLVPKEEDKILREAEIYLEFAH